jgi:hypothetical protein
VSPAGIGIRTEGEGKMKPALTAILVLNLAWVPTSHADTATINKTVSECINFVHALGDSFKKFDAYYNPATGRVENNVMYVADQPAIFQFNKCMAQHGLPLGPKKTENSN